MFDQDEELFCRILTFFPQLKTRHEQFTRPFPIPDRSSSQETDPYNGTFFPTDVTFCPIRSFLKSPLHVTAINA